MSYYDTIRVFLYDLRKKYICATTYTLSLFYFKNVYGRASAPKLYQYLFWTAVPPPSKK